MHVPTRKFLLTRRMPILPTLRTLLAATALARLEARPRGTRLASLPRVWALPTSWTSRQECSRVATMLLLRDADCQSQYTANAHAREREVDRRCHDHHRATRARGWRPRSGPCVPCRFHNTQELSHHRGRRLTVLLFWFVYQQQALMRLSRLSFGFLSVLFFGDKRYCEMTDACHI